MVIWLTGLSGSGKSTLCDALVRLLKPHCSGLVVLDGDQVRSAFGNDLGYQEEDRVRHIQRVQGIAKLLAEQGLTILVAVLYAHPDLLAWNRRHLPGYVEVYLEASLNEVQARDVKGLYAKAKQGEIGNVVGVDIPWLPPTSPDVLFHVGDRMTPEAMARHLIARVPQLAQALGGSNTDGNRT